MQNWHQYEWSLEVVHTSLGSRVGSPTTECPTGVVAQRPVTEYGPEGTPSVNGPRAGAAGDKTDS